MGHDAPSLDAPHPLDYSQNALALKRAIRVLEGACEQLCTTLAQPGHTICNVGVYRCFRAAAKYVSSTRSVGFPCSSPLAFELQWKHTSPTFC
jgi:hypothetical protein